MKIYSYEQVIRRLHDVAKKYFCFRSFICHKDYDNNNIIFEGEYHYGGYENKSIFYCEISGKDFDNEYVTQEELTHMQSHILVQGESEKAKHRFAVYLNSKHK